MATKLEIKEIHDCADFSPGQIFDCGQAFRWKCDEKGVYKGIAFGVPAFVRNEGEVTYILSQEGSYEKIWHKYFDMDRDYKALREELSREKAIAAACEFGRGIRILHQEPWEALCSFIISQCNNIPRIKDIIEKLCNICGDEINFNDETFFAFPSAKAVSELSEKELSSLHAGYRAAYIRNAANAVASGDLSLSELEALPTEKAKAELLKLSGVGEKVANCTLLFGMGKLNAFPVDVWMKRAISQFFGEENFDYSRFGNSAGLAQQYMFHYMRNNKQFNMPK